MVSETPELNLPEPASGPSRWERLRALLRRWYAAWKRVRIGPRRIIVGLLVVFAFGLLLWVRCGVRGCPNVQRLTAYQPGGASILYDAEGKPFADLAPVDHEVVRIDSLPGYVPAAFVAVEDKRFYAHNGVDYRRVAGAALADIKAGRFVQGFSTITMQLARNVWSERLPGQQRTLKRKILEVRVAREIERRYTKPEILELYLNHIYFGSGAYGIEAASRNYFGRPARDLTIAQAAMLAAMPKSPVIYNPRRNAERVRSRRDLVLSLMAAQGIIGDADARRARQARLGVRRDPPRRRGPADVAPYFADAVRRTLEDRLGEDLYSSPLRIHTTLDRTLQRVAEEELERQLRAVENGSFGRFSGPRYQRGVPGESDPDYLQGALVMMEAQTGAVRALVGGRDFQQSRFDRATRARRPAGSAFKPFVYATALLDGYVPSQHILDEPIRLELRGGEVWEPQNITGENEGSVSLRSALVRSKNLPTIRLAAEVGMDDVIDFAHRTGIRSALPDVPSLAIGTAAVTPLELTSAYTPFATLGTAVAPQVVTRVIDADGDVVWAPRPRKAEVMHRAEAWLLTDMLRDALRRGTGVAALRAGYDGPAAGKTGTTNEGSDVWFVGYTPDLVTTVWIGFDQPRAIVADASGGRIAAPVWGRVMRRAYRGRKEPAAWPRPENIVERRVDPNTGLALAPGCRPERGAAAEELFIRGSQPPLSCPRGTRTDRKENVFVRAGGSVRAFWHRAGDWLKKNFEGEEKQQQRQRKQERDYLGVPKLPRAETLRVPEVDPRIVEPARLRDSLLFKPMDLRLETLQIILPDSIRIDTLPVLPDTTRRRN